MPTVIYDEEDDLIPRAALIDLMQELADYALAIDYNDPIDDDGPAAWMHQITPPYTDEQADAYRSALIDANQYIGQLIGVNPEDL